MKKWNNIRLADFCRTGSGGTPSRTNEGRYFGGDIPWVKSGELKEGTIVETEETITQEALNESAAKIIPSGALLVALYGATVGRLARLGIDAATNQAVCYIIPDPKVANSEFLFHALKNQVPFWLSRRAGGAQPNISQQVIKDTVIGLPSSLAEQKRIAAILDEADGVRRKHLEAAEVAREMGEKLAQRHITRNPNCRPRPLKRWATIERDAIDPIDIPKMVKYVGLEHLDSEGGFLGEITEGDADLRSLKYRFTEKHVLYGKLRPYLRKTSRPTFSGVCSTEILPILAKPTANRDYLFHCLRLPSIVAMATEKCGGANLPRLSPRLLAEFALPIPFPEDAKKCIAEQTRIVALLDEADRLRQLHAKAANTASDLLASLSQRAFRGEL